MHDLAPRGFYSHPYAAERNVAVFCFYPEIRIFIVFAELVHKHFLKFLLKHPSFAFRLEAVPVYVLPFYNSCFIDIAAGLRPGLYPVHPP